jgi:hypothetical protein
VTDRDDSLDGIIDILKEPAELRSGFTDRVMAEIQRLPAHSDARPPVARVPWWRRQWTVRLTPLRGLALSGGMAALLFVALLAGRQSGQSSPAAPSEASANSLQFVLVAPEASTVALVGDFNDWSDSATPLVRAEGGVWTVTVPLPPGRYRYSFVVDGRVWRNDPQASAVEDEFGRPNSVVTVGGA